MLNIIKQYKTLFFHIIKNEFFENWAPEPRKKEIKENLEQKRRNPIDELKDENKISSIVEELKKLEWISLEKGSRSKEKIKILQWILNVLWYDISYKNKKWETVDWERAIDWGYGISVKMAVAILQADLWISQNNWVFDNRTFIALNSRLKEKKETNVIVETTRDQITEVKKDTKGINKITEVKKDTKGINKITEVKKDTQEIDQNIETLKL